MKKLFLMLLLTPVVALADEALRDVKACIAIFEPRPCVWVQKFYAEGKRVLVPAKFGFWDELYDERGEMLTFKWGLLRGTQKYFVYQAKRTPNAVLGKRGEDSCLFARR